MADGALTIIGAGKAGARACICLRENGWNGAITLVGRESHAPYDRPPLSKSVITGDGEQKPPYLADEPLLASIDVRFIKSNPAVAIDRAARTVTLADGETVAYRKLLLTLGAEPRHLSASGTDPSRLLYLRTFEDALAIRALRGRIRHLIVIGGGFIGLEVAASARKIGMEVTLIESLPRVLSRGVPQDIASAVAARHEKEGTTIVCGTGIDAVETSGDGICVRLKDGRGISGDYAVVGIGAIPITDLAEKAGLSIDNGIAVDETLQTSDPDIFAAGDCVSFPLTVYGGRRVRLESWRSAQDQGALAAANMLGKSETFTAVPWFWSDQHDLSLQIAGLPDEGRSTVRRDLGNGSFIQFHLADDGRLVAASGIGVGNAVARDIRVAEMMIGRGMAVDPALLADPDTTLKKLLR